MKITILVEQAAALELIIRCANADDPAVCTLQKALAALDKKIPATHSGDQLLLDPSEVLYGEIEAFNQKVENKRSNTKEAATEGIKHIPWQPLFIMSNVDSASD